MVIYSSTSPCHNYANFSNKLDFLFSLFPVQYHLTCSMDFPGGSDSRVCLQCGTPGFNPWVGKISWRRKWQPTPVFMPGKSHAQRSLVGYSRWGLKELDITVRLHFLSLRSFQVTQMMKYMPAMQETWV